MPLKLLIDGIPPLNLQHVYLTRELGSPVKWHFIADLKSAAVKNAPEVDFMNSFLKAQAVSVKAEWDPGGVVICPAAKVVGFSRGDGADWRGYVDRLDIFAESTAPQSDQVSPFLPRRRVHKADNMLQLFDQFKNIAETGMERLRDALEKLEFPDNKGKICIIQDGISDWDFFGLMIEHCRFMSPQADWLPLTLVGGVQPGSTAGKWLVVPGSTPPYRDWGEVSSRVVTFTEADGEPRYDFGTIGRGVPVPEFPSGSYPSLGIGRPWRRFGQSQWGTWSGRDLPLFIGSSGSEAMAWRVVDHVFPSEQDKEASDIAWETFVYGAPPAAEIASPHARFGLCPWVGAGTVSATDKNGPWITVTLDGFEDPNTADVRLATPFSGTDGTKGLHMVPENGTKVQLCWPGWFSSSIVLVGNTRWSAAQFPSPSLFLEETYTSQFEDVQVKKIGKVNVGSGLAVAVSEQTSLNSQSQFTAHADGADLKLSGGVVYTGRGM